MSAIKYLIALIRSWFKASGEEAPQLTRQQKKHKRHVHLTVVEKKNLYALWAEGEEPAELARAFNVSMSTVYRILMEYERKELRRKIRQKEAA